MMLQVILFVIRSLAQTTLFENFQYFHITNGLWKTNVWLQRYTIVERTASCGTIIGRCWKVQKMCQDNCVWGGEHQRFISWILLFFLFITSGPSKGRILIATWMGTSDDDIAADRLRWEDIRALDTLWCTRVEQGHANVLRLCTRRSSCMSHCCSSCQLATIRPCSLVLLISTYVGNCWKIMQLILRCVFFIHESISIFSFHEIQEVKSVGFK